MKAAFSRGCVLSFSRILTVLAFLGAVAMELATSSAFGASCEEIYERLHVINSDLADSFSKSRQIAPALIRGEQTPGWHDFEHLNQILQSLRTGKKAVAQERKLAELQKVINEIEKSIPDNPELIQLRDASKGVKPDNVYQPTEYQLKRQYQHLLWEVNQELPDQLKIRGVRIPFDPRRKVLVEQARQLVHEQEEKFKALYPTIGYDSPTDLAKAIRAEGGAVGRKLYNMIHQERVELVIKRPEQGRWWIPRAGFQNQRITGSSSGLLDSEWRDQVEAFRSAEDLANYKTKDKDLMPKYGYLRPGRGEKFTETGTAWYGTDAYVMRLDRVRDRLTWTAGDSLNWLKVKPNQVREGWADAFIPWKDRELMTPLLIRAWSEPKTRFGINLFTPLENFRSTNLRDTSYVELQFWGPITLDDVEAFEFQGAPPSGEFLEDLLKRGIKIRDGRQSPAVDWTPPVEKSGK